MDGGIDCIPGHHPKKRARILPDGVEPQELGLDDHYLPVGARSASLPSKGAEAEVANRASAGAYPRRGKVTLRGSACTSFPEYRRQKLVCTNREQRRMSSMELSKERWLQCYLDDSRMIQNRAMLHKCGPSCYKYAKDVSGGHAEAT